MILPSCTARFQYKFSLALWNSLKRTCQFCSYNIALEGCGVHFSLIISMMFTYHGHSFTWHRISLSYNYIKCTIEEEHTMEETSGNGISCSLLNNMYSWSVCIYCSFSHWWLLEFIYVLQNERSTMTIDSFVINFTF